MKTRKKKRITARQRKAWGKKATALRIDPTRTTTLRRRMCVDFSKRLAKVKLAVADLVVRQQVFRFQWGTLPTADKVAAFTNWLNQVVREQLFGLTEWWTKYLVNAYVRGAARSYDEVRRRKPTDQLVQLGGKQEFIRHLVRKQVQPKPVVNSEPNCGTGAGGFKKRNYCAKGSGLSDATRGGIGASKETILRVRNLDIGVVPGKGKSSWSGKGLQSFINGINKNIKDLQQRDLSNQQRKYIHAVLEDVHRRLAAFLDREYGSGWVGGLTQINEDVRNFLLSKVADAIKSSEMSAAIHHDAAEEITGNAGFDPDQPRDDRTGQWTKLSDAVIGAPRDRPMRGKDTPEQEQHEASVEAARLSHSIRQLAIHAVHTEIQEATQYGASLPNEEYQQLLHSLYQARQNTFAAHNLSVEIDGWRDAPEDKYHLARLHGWVKENHEKAANHLYMVLQYTPNRQTIQDLENMHREAAALHHDAAEMWHGGPIDNSSQENCGTGAGGFKPGNTCARKHTTLSDFAKHPLPGGGKERFSALEEGLEASKAAEEISQHLDVLTKDFLNRIQANPELDHVHDLAAGIARQVYWTTPQQDTIREYRDILEGKREPRWEPEGAPEWQDLVATHHRHQFDQHRKIIAGLWQLSQQLDNNRTVRDLLKRHREAAFLHSDASELLTGNRLAANIASQMQDVEGRFMSTRLHTLSQRLLGELQGITAAVAQRVARELLEGLEAGETAEQISKRITAVVDTIGRVRALALANTELVRAHAEGQLDALEDLGEEEVTAAVEWSTAGDNKVCSRCKPLDGVILHIEEARGLIPRHVNCRCSWSPAGTVQQQEGRIVKDSLKDVTAALKRSIISSPAEDTWFEGRSVKRQRPVLNWQPVAVTGNVNSYFSYCPRNGRGWCESSGEGGGGGGGKYGGLSDNPQSMLHHLKLNKGLQTGEYTWEGARRVRSNRADEVMASIGERATELGFVMETEHHNPDNTYQVWEHPDGHILELSDADDYPYANIDYKVVHVPYKYREGLSISRQAAALSNSILADTNYEDLVAGDNANQAMKMAREGRSEQAANYHASVAKFHREHAAVNPAHHNAMAAHMVAADYHKEKAGLQ